ncbi:YebO family protein [Pantoea sp. SJZ147]|uniref:YebO family protein n=1 Tax=Pantoea sp. SJZ147 TaxID=2572896 RepID=UPI0011A68033|nr:YebO family protein [Pantoea sp. SJZ147]TWD41863.1 YebO-like protein [Pantoea sp. SJZ147]
MNELAANAGPVVSYGVMGIMLIVALILWFYVNRASVRANEQIALLASLLEEQKKQNALLKRLIEKQNGTSEQKTDAQPENGDFIRLIPER